MNKIILNENDIKTLVTESVKNVLKESYNDPNVISSTINIKNKGSVNIFISWKKCMVMIWEICF